MRAFASSLLFVCVPASAAVIERPPVAAIAPPIASIAVPAAVIPAFSVFSAPALAPLPAAMDAPRTAPVAAVSAPAPLPVSSVESRGDDFAVNGRAARYVGSGDFKEVVGHPTDPDLVVKIFYAKWASSVPESRREAADIRLLEPLGVVPVLVQHGTAELRGQDAGFIVQERVHGTTLDHALTPGKLQYTRELFERLAAAGLELTDVRSTFKLRTNIMVGSTRSGGYKAYLVDPEVARSRRSPAALRRFYDELLARIAAR
jgi:hypothetical protein